MSVSAADIQELRVGMIKQWVTQGMAKDAAVALFNEIMAFKSEPVPIEVNEPF